MSSSTVVDTGDDLPESTRGLGPQIGVFVCVLVIAVIFTVALKKSLTRCLRLQLPLTTLPNDSDRTSTADEESVSSNPTGLDETTIDKYPKLLYSNHAEKGTNHDELKGGSSCSICLTDYNEADVLRLLPGCAHFFHLECADTWLRLHPTCPICRTWLLRSD